MKKSNLNKPLKVSLRVMVKGLILAFILFLQPVIAKDIIYVNKRHSDKDTRSIYPYAVLNKALELSSEKYGEFEVIVASEMLPNNRTIDFLEKGELFNVVMVVTTKEWEDRTIPIRIPLRLGALAFRLLAINKAQEGLFSEVSGLDDLKHLIVGLHRNWATWNVMTHLHFNVASVFSYEALFGMLSKQRLDYIPRGVHEIYDELNLRKDSMPDLMIEPNLALYIPSPFYMFVSPKYPEIAERLTFGLEKMVKDGILKSMFNQYYGENFVKAQLDNRKIINVGNPLLPEKTPLHRKELWLKQIQDLLP